MPESLQARFPSPLHLVAHLKVITRPAGEGGWRLKHTWEMLGVSREERQAAGLEREWGLTTQCFVGFQRALVALGREVL